MIQREGEQWKNIIEFPIYQISNFGNVRNTKTEKELKQSLGIRGYYYVTLFRQDFKQNKFIHRLVCQYFNANPNNHNFVDHINGNRNQKHRQCYFTNEEEAARKYDMKAIELFGEFAKTNFPKENYQQEEGKEEDQFQTGN